MTEASGGRPKKDVLASVQFLRGVAASCVVAIHLVERYAKRGLDLQSLPEWIGALGYVGVGTFFAISGFIMVHTTAKHFGVPGKSGGFIIRRLIRVAPLYYCTTILMVVFQYYTHSMSAIDHFQMPDFQQFVMSAAFIPYIQPSGLIQPIYELGWTLEYEMFFYLIFGLGIILPLRAGMSIIVGSLLSLVLLGTLLPEPSRPDSVLTVVYFFTRPILLYFLIGMAIALILRATGPVPVRLSEPAICLAAFGFLAAAVLFEGYWIHIGIAAALVSATIFRPASPPSSAMFTRLACAFGDASYSMYLTHSFFLGAFALATLPLASSGAAGLTASILSACLFCFGAAWCCWRFVEMPMTKAFNGLLLVRSRSATVAS